VRAEPAEASPEGRRIAVRANGIEVAVEFKLLKGNEAEFLMAKDVEQTLALYKSLKEMGARVEITPEGVKIDSEALWTLVAVAVERGAPSGLPAEVIPGVELLKVYNVGEVRMYIFRAEGVHYYFAVRTREGWRAASGKYSIQNSANRWRSRPCSCRRHKRHIPRKRSGQEDRSEVR